MPGLSGLWSIKTALSRDGSSRLRLRLKELLMRPYVEALL